MNDADGPPRPVLRVVPAGATPEEIAAVLAVVGGLGAAGGGGASAAPGSPGGPGAPATGDGGPVSVWADRGQGHRAVRARTTPLTPSPHGWRTAYWPR